MPDSSQVPRQYRPLYISRLDVKLSERSRKKINAVELYIGNKTLRVFQAAISAGCSHKETFTPAIALQPGESFHLSVHCSTPYRHKKLNINMAHQEISSGMEPKGVIRTYERTADNINGIISLHLLRPTTDDILEISPWFRVLIIGNSGAGKTSLIQKVFGVNEIHAAIDARGISDIDKEFVSSQNGRFVFHDSDGFEEGDTRNVERVKRFVKERNMMPQTKDRLHAVWLCLETPYSEGRLLQSGVERFLESRGEILGDVPLVIVLTKVDLLDDQLKVKMMEDQLDGESFEQHRSKFLETYCFEPLRKVAVDVPCVIVSSSPEYSSTHANVINATKERVGQNIGEDPSMVIGMAQRASIKVTFESSIAIGKKKYWSRLAKSAFLTGHTLKDCVKVLHEDIVAVWNFNDPDEVLHQERFINALFHAGDFDVPEGLVQPNVIVAVGAAKGILSCHPVIGAVFAVVDAALLAALLVYETHKQFARVIKALMLYIVGSMFVMQIIYLLSFEDQVTSEVVDYAVYTYLLSKKQEVRRQIDDFNVERGMYPGGPDYILDQVELLARSFSLSDEEIKEMRQAMKQQESAETLEGKCKKAAQ